MRLCDRLWRAIWHRGIDVRLGELGAAGPRPLPLRDAVHTRCVDIHDVGAVAGAGSRCGFGLARSAIGHRFGFLLHDVRCPLGGLAYAGDPVVVTMGC